MNMTQKTVCVIYHDKPTLPILDYIDKSGLVSLGMNKGVILWVYKGLAMLIPPERVANAMQLMEAAEKFSNGKTKWAGVTFNADDAIKLPSKIAVALLGSDNERN